MARPTRATIHPARIRHNGERVRALAPRARIMACVKADGYGHGSITSARALHGVADGFAVACIEEACALRDGGCEEPILLLEGPLEQCELTEAVAQHLSICISHEQQLQWLEQVALAAPLDCWLKIDTGMHRLGIPPADTAMAYRRLRNSPNARENITLLSHFARAEEPPERGSLAQLQCFDEATEGLSGPRSCANSAAILGLPQSHMDWVRPGYMLYGGSPFCDPGATACGLQAAMELTSSVISLRDVAVGETVGYGGRWRATRPSRIATIAIGYGDGYPRHAPDGTPVLVAGQRAPLAGKVSMDLLTVDVTDLQALTAGAPVLLWGEALPVDEIAQQAGTIGYELLAGMPARVPRVLAEPH
ncbi:MAG: alanine racemase [Halieaceae bacterium]|jgi:alanine racemase